MGVLTFNFGVPAGVDTVRWNPPRSTGAPERLEDRARPLVAHQAGVGEFAPGRVRRDAISRLPGAHDRQSALAPAWVNTSTRWPACLQPMAFVIRNTRARKRRYVSPPGHRNSSSAYARFRVHNSGYSASTRASGHPSNRPQSISWSEPHRRAPALSSSGAAAAVATARRRGLAYSAAAGASVRKRALSRSTCPRPDSLSPASYLPHSKPSPFRWQSASACRTRISVAGRVTIPVWSLPPRSASPCAGRSLSAPPVDANLRLLGSESSHQPFFRTTQVVMLR